jgi:hypothetical protein
MAKAAHARLRASGATPRDPACERWDRRSRAPDLNLRCGTSIDCKLASVPATGPFPGATPARLRRLRWQWRRPRSTSWRIDETYVNVHGKRAFGLGVSRIQAECVNWLQALPDSLRCSATIRMVAVHLDCR